MRLTGACGIESMSHAVHRMCAAGGSRTLLRLMRCGFGGLHGMHDALVAQARSQEAARLAMTVSRVCSRQSGFPYNLVHI